MTSHCIGPGHGVWLTALHCYSFLIDTISYSNIVLFQCPTFSAFDFPYVRLNTGSLVFSYVVCLPAVYCYKFWPPRKICTIFHKPYRFVRVRSYKFVPISHELLWDQVGITLMMILLWWFLLISTNLFWWRNKLVYILDSLRVSVLPANFHFKVN